MFDISTNIFDMHNLDKDTHDKSFHYRGMEAGFSSLI